MNDYSGTWTGEMHGTNYGTFALNLKQDGSSVQGIARFAEPRVGTYECSVHGSIGPEIRLVLTPIGQAAALGVGRVEVVALVQPDGSLTGEWTSPSKGRKGNFSARRQSPAMAVPAGNAPPLSDVSFRKTKQPDKSPESATATREASKQRPESSESTMRTGMKTYISREAKDSELCLDIHAYANAIADLFTSAAEESDFVFALYGSWGRGKSTLIKRTTHILATDGAAPDSIKNYTSVCFSAWKYPTRPEVWVYLYQQVVRAAQGSSRLQRLRIGFRTGLLRHGWSPLILGLVLLAASRLQINFASWLLEGFGIAGLLIVASFVWNTTRLGKLVTQYYFSMPTHAEKLGLQAVIGEDLKNLLKVWITPRLSSAPDQKSTNVVCDFSRWPARSGLLTIVALIWVTLSLVGWKMYQHISPSSGGTDPFIYRNVLIALFTGIAVASAGFAVAIACRPVQYRRALLVVDDLDRCEPEQMLAVIQSLRLFLDDEEMSRRLQVAMLIDRRILCRAMITKAESSNVLQKGDSKEEFFRQQEEKLFVASLELPPLDREQARELGMLTVNREYREQLEANIESKEEALKRLDFTGGKTPIGLEGAVRPIGHYALANPDIVEVYEDQEKMEGDINRWKEELKTFISVTSRGISPPAAAHEAHENVIFSDQERLLLAQTVNDIPLSQITPRSYRSFVLRYQLARLLLYRLGRRFHPKAVIDYLAVRIFKPDAVPGGALSTEVQMVVDSVVGSNLDKGVT